jgi:mannosyltransferase OCH1-like enzyme
MLVLDCIVLWIVTVCAICGPVVASAAEPWNAPVFPERLPDYHFMLENALGKGIPRHLWMGFKTIPPVEERSTYLTSMLDRAAHSNWTIHLMDDKATDDFMEKYYGNTSIYWAYHNINPEVGAAKGDIWRYCALYMFGGFYMDDDAYIAAEFDDMIHEHDQLVLTWEKNRDHSACFLPYYRLSRECLNERFHRKTEGMFGGMILVTWAMAVIPRHKLFQRVIETVVDAVRSQYLGEPINYMGRYDSGSKWIFCSTGPNMLTAAAREVFAEQEEIAEHQHAHLQHEHDTQDVAEHIAEQQLQPGDANFTYTYTLYARDFHAFGGQFKPMWTDPTKHYMHRMHHEHIPLLKEYSLDGKIVTVDGRELFLVENGQRRGFRDWDAFVDNKFNHRAAKILSKEALEAIPLNSTVVTSEEAPTRLALRETTQPKHTVCVAPELE